MQSKKLKKLIMIIFVLSIFSACTKDVIVTDPPTLAAPVPPKPGQTSYAGVIQPIFTAKCAGCHYLGGVAPNLVTGKSYQALTTSPGMIDTSTPSNSILYKKMATGGSMASKCTPADADSVLRWITQGAINN
ncbi:MAG: cytochrome c [Bacteroidota bacterium]